MKPKLFLILLALNFLIQGCGFRSLVVPNLDWIIARRLNQSFHLDSDKKKELQKDIAGLLEKSKPQVSRIKNRLSDTDLKKIDVFKRASFFSQEYETFVKNFAPIFAKYLSQLDANQIEKFKEANEDGNQQIADEKEDAEENLIENYEKFLGDLTKEQKTLLTLNSKIFAQFKEQRLLKRKKYQAQIYKIMSIENVEQRRAQIVELTLSYNKLNKENPNRKRSLYLLEEVLKLSTPEQSEHFKEEIEDLMPWLDSYLLEKFI